MKISKKRTIVLVFLVGIVFFGSFLIIISKIDFQSDTNVLMKTEPNIQLKSADERDLYPEEFLYSKDNIPEGAQFDERKVLVDNQDDIYISGCLYWDNGTDDMLVAKLNSYGTLLWQKTVSEIDVGDLPYVVDMVTDSNDNLYVAGYAGKTLDYTYLFKYDTWGHHEWTQIWDQWGVAAGMAIDENDDIYIVGYTGSSGKRAEVCIIKYNASGNQMWNVTYGGIDYDYGHDMAISELGNIYVLASTQSYGSGNRDVWFFEIDSNGDMIWNKTFGTPASDFCSEIAVDSSSNIYIQMALNGFLDIFKFSPIGNYICNSSIAKPGSYPDHRYEEMIIQDDYIYSLMGGRIWKFNSSCGFLWKTDQLLYTYTFSMDSKGNIYTAGPYEDGFIMKLSSVPYIIVDNPYENQIFSRQAPQFNLTIFEPDIFLVWYSLDLGTTYHSISGTDGVIDQEEWASLDDGYIVIYFFVEDDFGNVGSEYIVIFKDAEAPSITVHEPIENKVYGSTPPSYNISLYGLNILYGDDIDSCWYTMEQIGYGGYGGEIPIDGTRENITGIIASDRWKYIKEGKVNITFHASDVFGNERNITITVEKRLPTQKKDDPTLLIIVVTTTVAVAVIAITIILRGKNSRKK